MRLEIKKIRLEKYYRIGYMPTIDKYVIATVVTWIAWHNKQTFPRRLIAWDGKEFLGIRIWVKHTYSFIFLF